MKKLHKPKKDEFTLKDIEDYSIIGVKYKYNDTSDKFFVQKCKEGYFFGKLDSLGVTQGTKVYKTVKNLVEQTITNPLVEDIYKFYNYKELMEWVLNKPDLFSQPLQIIKWNDTKYSQPKRLDEDYLVGVKNKNKEDGIILYDLAHFSSEKEWIKKNTWEKVFCWADLKQI